MTKSGEAVRELDELELQYRLFPLTRDLLVESNRDATFYRWLLTVTKVGGVKVFPIDTRVTVPRDAVESLGYEWGVRGRLVTLAVLAEKWGLPEPSATCLVDADFEVLRPTLPKIGSLIATTYPSLETYGLLDGAFSKFAISTGFLPSRVEGAHREALLGLNTLFIVRYLLHSLSPSVGMIDNIHRHLRVRSGKLQIDDRSLVERSINASSSSALAKNVSADLDEYARPTPPNLSHVRGHDIAAVIRLLLGLKGKWADQDIIEDQLLMAVSIDDMQGDEMLARLTGRLGSHSPSTS